MRKAISLAISVVLLFSCIPASFAGQTVIYKDGNLKPVSVSFEDKDSLKHVKVYTASAEGSANPSPAGGLASVSLTDDRAEGNYAAKVTVGSSANSNKNFIINLLDLGSEGLATSSFSKITLSVKPAMGAKSITFYANYISSDGSWTTSPSAVSVPYTVGANLESGKWNTVDLDLSVLGLSESCSTIQAVVNENSTWEFDHIRLKRQQAGNLSFSEEKTVSSGGSSEANENARLLYYTSGTSDLSKGKIAGLDITGGRSAASTDGSVQLLNGIDGIGAEKVVSSADGKTIYYVKNDGTKDVVSRYDRSAGTSKALTDFTAALKTYWSINDAMKAAIEPYNKTVDRIGSSPDGKNVAILKKGVRMPAEMNSSALIKTDVIVFNDGKSIYRSGIQSTFASTAATEIKSQNYWGIDSFSFVSNVQMVGKEKYYVLSGGAHQATGAVRYKSFALSGDSFSETTIDENTYLNLLSRQSMASNDQYFVYKAEADNDTNNYVANKYGDDRSIGYSANKVTVSYTDTTGLPQTATAATLKSQIMGMSQSNADKNFVIVKTKPNTTITSSESSNGNTTSTGGGITNSTSTNSGITTTTGSSLSTSTGSSSTNTKADTTTNATDISNIKNLITNGGFENGLTGWTFATGMAKLETSNPYDGTSYVNRGNTDFYQTLSSTKFVNGHKYYAASSMFDTVGNQPLQFALINTAWTFPFVDIPLRAAKNQWVKSSGIFTYSTVAIGSSPYVDLWSNVSMDTLFIDSVILVDLTAHFGPGKEPSKEWCDAHITYNAIQNDSSLSPFCGTWSYQDRTCAIAMDGETLKATNETGNTAAANMINPNTINVPNWRYYPDGSRTKEDMNGTLSNDGNYIYWTNGATWIRKLDSQGLNTVSLISSSTSSSTTQSEQQNTNANTTSYNNLTQSGSEKEWRSSETSSSTTNTSTVIKYDWYAIDINKGTAVPLDFDYDNGIVTAVSQAGNVMVITYVANGTTYTYRYDTLTKKLYNDADGLETIKYNLYLATKQPDGRYSEKKIVSLKSNVTDIKTNHKSEAAFVKLLDNSWYLVNVKTSSAAELKLNLNKPQVLYVTDDNKLFLYDDNSRYSLYDPAADSLKEIRPADAANDKYLVVDNGRQILYRTTTGTLKTKYLEDVKVDSGQYYLVSFDGKNTWQTYKYGKWQTVSKTSEITETIMKQYGMRRSEVNALESSDFETLYDGNRQIYSIDLAAMLSEGIYYGSQNIDSVRWFLDQDSNDNPLYGEKTYFAKAADVTAENARIIDKLLIHETGPAAFTGYYFFEQDGEYFYYDENGWQDEESNNISEMLKDVEEKYVDITLKGMSKKEVMAIPAASLTERFVNKTTSGGAVSFRLIYCSKIDDEAIDQYIATPELAVEHNVFPTNPYKIIIRQTDGNQIVYTNLTKDQAEDFMAWIQQRQAGYGNVFYHMITGTVDEFINYYMVVNVRAERE